MTIPPVVRSVLSPLLKIGVSAGLIAWAISKSPGDHWAAMWQQLRSANLGWAAFSVLMLLSTQIICLFRWRRLLALQHIHLRRRHVGALSLIGVFFGQFSIGMVGGDFVRVLYTTRFEPGRKAEATLSVAVDRLFGLAGLCALALVSLPLNWGLLANNGELTPVLWGIGLCLGAGIALLLGLLVLELPGPHQQILQLRRHLPFPNLRRRFHEGFRLYARDWRTSGYCLLLSVMVHAIGFLAAWGVARALHLPDPPVTFGFICGMMPIVLLMISLPISIGGFGVREVFCVLFFRSIGLGEAQAWAFSLGFFAVNLALGLIGGLVYLLYRVPVRHETPAPETP
jgi:hypothetical protein